MTPTSPSSGRRTSPTAAASLGCAATALWVSFGALTFLDTSNRAPYVGILPSPIWLALLLCVAGALLYGLRPTAGDAAPLWLSAVLLLPWLPLRLPLAVFLWTGHTAVWVWLTIGAAFLAARRHVIVRAVLPSLSMRPRRAAVLAGFLSLAAYG